MATYSTWRLRTFASITVVIQVKLSRNVLVQTFSFANDRTLFQNALSTLLTSLGVSQGQQAPGSQAKSLKLCLCLSRLSLSFLSLFLWYLHSQTTSIHMVTRWLPTTLSSHSSRQKSPRKAFLPSFFFQQKSRTQSQTQLELFSRPWSNYGSQAGGMLWLIKPSRVPNPGAVRVEGGCPK